MSQKAEIATEVSMKTKVTLGTMTSADIMQMELTKTINKLNATHGLYERALELKRDAEQQRDDLLPYTKHRQHCPAGIEDSHHACNCGLSELRAKCRGKV